MKTNKKTRLFLLTVAILLAVGFAYPSASQAALVPCGTKGGNACTLCDFIVGMHKIIAWGRNVSISVGLLVITVAGIMYIISSGNSSLVEKAKAAIKNVIIGMVVLLTAWVVINYGLFLLGANNNIGLQTGVDGNLSEKWWQANLTCVSQTSLVTVGGTLGSNAADADDFPRATGISGPNPPGIERCGPNNAGTCFDINEIEWDLENNGMDESSITDNFSHLTSGADCSRSNNFCFVSKVTSGGACQGENSSGTLASGKCSSSCSTENTLTPDTNSVTPQNINVGADYPVCRDDLKCCFGSVAADVCAGVNPDALKVSLSSGSGKICTTTSCPYTLCMSALSNRKPEGSTKSFTDIIKEHSWVGSDTTRLKAVQAVMCRESQGYHMSGTNVKLAPDLGCGLMQITKAAITGQAACNAAYPNTEAGVTANIHEGIDQLEDKYSDAKGDGTYGGGITKYQNTFSRYNCCANGQIPDSESASCATSDGWVSLPKWACPLDPGTGTFNMCKVKDYACSVSACL